MKLRVLLMLLLIPYADFLFAQQNPPTDLHFTQFGVKEGLPEGSIQALLKDKAGYFWIGTQNGLIRYDGYAAKKYNFSAANAYANSMIRVFEDRKSNLWISSTNGVYVYDRSADTIVKQQLFKEKTNIPFITFFQDDNEGNTWMIFNDRDKNSECLGLFKKSTGQFTVFGNKEKGAQYINVEDFHQSLFIDQHNSLWIPADNALLEYLPAQKKFIPHYFDTAHKTIAWFLSEDSVKHEVFWFLLKDKKSGKIESIAKYNVTTGLQRTYGQPGWKAYDQSGEAGINFTDSRGRVWFCTAGGLALYNAASENFTSYDIPEKEKNKNDNLIAWATEDRSGNFWCWSAKGILYFNTGTGRYTRYVYNEKNPEGLLSNRIRHFSLDMHGLPLFGVAQLGLQWVNKDRSKFNLYRNNPGQLHHFPGGTVNAFAETTDGTRWIGSQHGLYSWQPALDSFTLIHFEKNMGKDIPVTALLADRSGRIWFGADGNHDSIQGLYCYDPATKKTKSYRHKDKDSLSLSYNFIGSILEDSTGNIWVGTIGGGLCRFNTQSQTFTRYPYIFGDFVTRPGADSLDDDEILSMYRDKNNMLWIGTNNGGLNKFDPVSGKFTSFLNQSPGFSCVVSITEDDKGNVWAGTYMGGLFSLNEQTNSIKKVSENEGLLYGGSWGTQEDSSHNLWTVSPRGISILDRTTARVRTITSSNGLPQEPISLGLFKTADGNLLFGCKDGFISLNPHDFTPDSIVPVVHIETIAFTNTKDKKRGKDSIIVRYGQNEISLKYDENRVTFTYVGLLYQNASLVRYAYRLDGYDKDWIQAGTQRTVTYTNLSPGNYYFHVKAANSDGVWTLLEDAIPIVISPPWWNTWWAWLLYAIVFIVLLRAYIVNRSRALRRQNRLLEERVIDRTHQLSEANEELKTTQENIAAQRDQLAEAITELKSTQAQLIQSEKMASLGELTAGIAHEIQNPLNFVNNFSEVNSELVDELQIELKAGNAAEAIAISNDIKDNEQKINHHGKRAEAIVKGMLQHSRSTGSQKEPADINALADEYLRLSYHGIRAKDKVFNATLRTGFDKRIEKINIVPQDIGRVLLNLYNNAFFAVNERKQKGETGYEPTVSVSTKKINDTVEISVQDNGNGIPDKVLNKIYQPFFTTKPTGQGTGLGLSLSYDIVKAHGGEIKVETKESMGTNFIVRLPM